MTVRENRHCICRRAALAWRFRVWLRRSLNQQQAPHIRSRIVHGAGVAS